MNLRELCVLQLRFCPKSSVESTLQPKTMIYIWLISGSIGLFPIRCLKMKKHSQTYEHFRQNYNSNYV